MSDRKTTRLSNCALCLFVLIAAISSVTSYPQAKSATAPDIAFQRNKLLSRGINCGSDPDRMREDDFKVIKDANFNSIRLMIAWNAHCDQNPPYKIDPSWFRRIDWFVERALAQKLAIVLDFHSYPLLSFNSAATTAMAQHNGPPPSELEPFDSSRSRFVGLWTQIAEHYQKAPNEVFFELMNEPSGYLGPQRLNALYAELINIIRKNNPTRTIIVNPEVYQKYFTLDTLMLPQSDRNLIVAIHCYDPIPFTHQSGDIPVTYVPGADKWVHVTWGEDIIGMYDVAKMFYGAAGWSMRQNRPLYLNEFGADNNADVQSQASYYSFMCRNAEKMGMSWAAFVFDGDLFGKYDRSSGRWNKPVLDAIIPPARP